MKKILKKTIIFLLIPLTFPFVVINLLLKGDHKERTEKEEPDTIQTQYPDPFQGRNIIVKSINTTASVVTGFIDDVFPE